MIAALPIFDIFTGKQARNIFCLNDQSIIACFMIIRGVYNSVSVRNISKRLQDWMLHTSYNHKTSNNGLVV